MNKIINEKSDFPKRIKMILKALELTQSGLASKMGVSQGIISEFSSGTREPSKEFIFGLSNMEISLDWFLTGEGEMFLQKNDKSLENTQKTGLRQLPVYSEAELPDGAFVVPLLDQKLFAGSGSHLPDDDSSKALIRVPAYLSRYGDKIAALTVDGDSMYPTLRRGDMVVCDSCGWSGEGIYALRMSGSGFVKRLTKRPGKIVIISDNPKYPPQEEPESSEDIQIIGRVHCAITKVE
ncbi:MAG: helix-turn-helix domain-containing protein [Treponema sp.]|nr:helix-turn-helix domain-containing protein [Treponema sp.]